jgi:hypothetical protein
LAESLQREQPQLVAADDYQALSPKRLVDARTLHLDDVSDIPMLDKGRDVRFMQDRARLRAGNGDLVASSAPEVPGYEEYCRDQLGLGSPEWLRPPALAHPLRIAAACWEDRETRRRLLRELRQGGLFYVHPHMGTLPVWQLASMLHRWSRRRVEVIAPPPPVTAWANNKLAFTDTVTRLFGASYVPRTLRASNIATLALHVKQLAPESKTIVVKLPDSAGGGGNLVFEAARFRSLSLSEVHAAVRKVLESLQWNRKTDLLVGSWQTGVLCSPSAQLWIPPEEQGPPLVEGIFQQMAIGAQGMFVGSHPAWLPPPVAEEIANRSYCLALLYQQLGYVGRCSFDLLLVGSDMEHSRPQFVECNGRWGGTSVPMMLLNRLFRDWTQRPFATRVCQVPGLQMLSFTQLLRQCASDAYDARTGAGSLIFFNPGRIQAQSGIGIVALAPSWLEAARRLEQEIPERLQQCVSGRACA